MDFVDFPIANFCFCSDSGDYEALAGVYTQSPTTIIEGAGAFVEDTRVNGDSWGVLALQE